ncbi:Succinylglutamate desuccinylase / Aspartoacylase family protein [Pseudovibrio sp. Ad46]|uniref:succinylglutamate desuccinylase/aspartoacylase family protein n=1 Tax=Pseudovibrio sp. Ad46 TaxID=989432 RepID=UPI0007AE8374|nr:succinylglutamate desuccinylase/aspartoacylase family protein [Pseudovibrio sp. Ad46]KZK91897.1 Succinylglutamate desuccinylase / Aspartoacylase family protein [Pseudovibrio sp. Ad46]
MKMTGDILSGVPVVDKLSVDELTPGTHRFFFRATTNSLGNAHHLPVIVVKGRTEGTKLFLQSTLHGDEVQGIDVIHQVLPHLDPAKLKGTVVLVPGANPPGMQNVSRYYPAQTETLTLTNLNRMMPGDANSSNAGSRFAYALWHNLYMDNADIFLDLHTDSTGTAYPFFIYADFRIAEVCRLAALQPADQILEDDGIDGSVETELVRNGIPSLTLELGCANVFNPEITRRGVQGVLNTMIDYGMIDGTVDLLGIESFVGTEQVSVQADQGGFARVQVKLNEDVVKGQQLATMTNSFGDVIATYTAPCDGRVLSVCTAPLREPGTLVVQLLRRV